MQPLRVSPLVKTLPPLQVSDDSGSARDGGDLGYVIKGSFDQSFDDALFAL